MSDAVQSQPKGPSLFWLVYGQIAAMLGAFSLLVFLMHFVDVGLKGVIRDAFDGWVQYVRPVVGYPLRWLVDLLPEAWRFKIAPVWIDYFAVGAVSVMSLLRGVFLLDGYGLTDDKNEPRWMALLFVLPFAFFLWPVLLFLVIDMVRTKDSGSKLGLLWIAPLFYLALLFAANAWLL